jgi:hypothetical protein
MFGDLIKDGFRYKVFDRTTAQSESLSAYPYRSPLLPPLRSQRIKNKRDFCGIQGASRLHCQSEKIFDSSMPSIEGCLEVDGTKPFIIDDIATMFPGGDSVLMRGKSYGSVLFDLPSQFVGSFGQFLPDNFINNSWNLSFPFEEKYSKIPRIIYKNISLKSSFSLAGLFSEDIQILQKKGNVNHFLPGRFSKDDLLIKFDFCLDHNLEDYSIKPGSFPKKVQMTTDDLLKFMFGFGDVNTLAQVNVDGDLFWAGNKYQPDFRESTLLEFDPVKIPLRSESISPIIRGWRYGVYSGILSQSSAVFRRGSYGQFRDMLEQRVYTKFFEEDGSGGLRYTEPPITVRFVDDLDRTVDPLKTWSQNITRDASSTLPFFDGIANNRPEVDINNLGKTLVTLDI